MPTDDPFVDLIQRIRAGDEAAATELVKRFEPEIRRAVRIRMANPQLQPVLDSMDVAQSVMANFFVRVAAGQYELDSPAQLVKLLVKMAKNKLTDQARRQSAGIRDRGRVQGGGDEALAGVPTPENSPSVAVSNAELLQRLRQLLTPDEMRLAEMRAMGNDWAAIAQEFGESPEALRKRYSRALDRAARQVGLDEVRDD